MSLAAKGRFAPVFLSWFSPVRLFGPVLFYDLVRMARRNRYYVLRLAYIGVITVLFYWQYRQTFSFAPRFTFGQPFPFRSQVALFAEQFFSKFMLLQFFVVILLTPVYSAGAIAEEKDKKTLEFLLATGLSGREIVLSKLMARLANLTLIILAGLPVLSAIQFFGGVDPNVLLASFAAVALTMMSLVSLSVAISVYARKPRDAILMTYFVIAAYIGLGIFGQYLASNPAVAKVAPILGLSVTLGKLVDGYNAGNVPVLIYKLNEAMQPIRPGVPPPTLSALVPAYLLYFAIFHGLLALLTAIWAALRLREVALTQTSGAARPQTSKRRGRRRPYVGRVPMVWKEVFLEPAFRLTLMGRVVVTFLVAVSFAPPFWIILTAAYSGRWGILQTSLHPWARITGTAVACLLLIGVGVRASTCIGGERDRDTLDALLAAPLQSHDILFGKWLGSLLSVRWGWLWLAGIWGVALLTGSMAYEAVLISMVVWLALASAFAGIGIWFSTRCRTTMRATLLTLVVMGFVSLGHWALLLCCLPISQRGFFWSSGVYGYSRYWYSAVANPVAALFSAMSPPELLYSISIIGHRLERTDLDTGIVAYVGVFLWAIGSVWLWSFTRRRFRLMTARMPYRRPASPGAGV